jgi:quercetin dioxygenase-like cupin family protein
MSNRHDTAQGRRGRQRVIPLIAALTLNACGSGDGIRDPASEAGSSGAIITPITSTEQTISGQPFKLPQGPAQMVAISVDNPAGAALAIHQHPWSRFFYVERGTLRVVNHDTGESQEFKAGQVQAEAVDEWHEGRAVGDGPVHLIVIDLVPPGKSNTILKQ